MSQVLIAALGVVQVLGLALIALRQDSMRRHLDGHLTKLEDQRATKAEIQAREP